MRRMRWLTAIVALALVATACGGNGGGESQPSQPAETAAAAGTAPTSDAANSSGAADAEADEAPAADSESEAVGGDETGDLLVAPVDTTTSVAPPADDSDAGAGSPSEPQPQRGGTLRVGVVAEGDGLNPAANSFSGPVYIMGYSVFDPLAYYDTEGNWIPMLAESWTKIGDGTRWQMKVREGIRFHDGTELTADDVVATLSAQLADPVLSLAYRPVFDPAEPIRRIDEYTVEYVGVRPSARLPLAFTSQLGMILPSEWLERSLADPTLNQMPVGTGPFMVESRVPHETTVLVRNPDYWAADTIDVYLDRIEIHPITDSTVASERLLAGELDLVVVDGPDAILALREAAEVGVGTVENQLGEESLAFINAQSPVFSDIRARQALTFATDQDTYLELIGQGTASAADSMFHRRLVWNNPDVVQETNMAQRAAPLVDAYCADSPQNCTDGRINMRFGISGPSVDSERAVGLLNDTWSEFFNVDTSVKPLSELIIDVVLGNFDVALAEAFGSVDPDSDAIWMECAAIGFISLNFNRYCDPERDALIFEQRATDDLDRRVEIWRRIQEINQDAYIYIFLNHANWVIGWRDNVHNVCGQIGPTGEKLFCNNQGRVWLNQLWLN